MRGGGPDREQPAVQPVNGTASRATATVPASLPVLHRAVMRAVAALRDLSTITGNTGPDKRVTRRHAQGRDKEQGGQHRHEPALLRHGDVLAALHGPKRIFTLYLILYEANRRNKSLDSEPRAVITLRQTDSAFLQPIARLRPVTATSFLNILFIWDLP